MYIILYYVCAIMFVISFVLGIYASIKVNSNFNKFSSFKPETGLSTQEATQKMLLSAGLSNIQVGEISGKLTDNYNPKTKTISLSASTRESASLAGFAVIAHEIGHAIQDNTGYAPLKIRNKIVPLVNIGTVLFYPLFLVGLLLLCVASLINVGFILIWVAVILYFLSTVFYLVTLPVERDASRRALALLQESGVCNEDEIYPAKQVLKAAELTYVAALLTSVTYFLRFLLYVLAATSKRKK